MANARNSQERVPIGPLEDFIIGAAEGAFGIDLDDVARSLGKKFGKDVAGYFLKVGKERGPNPLEDWHEA